MEEINTEEEQNTDIHALTGKTVSISGLKGRPELNGTLGNAIAFDDAKGRYNVQVPSGEVLALKPTNLTLVQEGLSFLGPDCPGNPAAAAPSQEAAPAAPELAPGQEEMEEMEEIAAAPSAPPSFEDAVEAAPSAFVDALEAPASELEDAPATFEDALEEEEPEIEYDMEGAKQAKEWGNKHFVAAEFEEAMDYYTEAIELANPKAEETAVYYCNRGACLLKMGQYQGVVDDCTAALALKPKYVKAMLRRGQAYELLEKYQEAIDDMKGVVEEDPTVKAASDALPRLEKAQAEYLEKQKEEMIGKLKDLGNSFLGKFGMSLDNFQAVQDPATGSYNISFNQNK